MKLEYRKQKTQNLRPTRLKQEYSGKTGREVRALSDRSLGGRKKASFHSGRCYLMLLLVGLILSLLLPQVGRVFADENDQNQEDTGSGPFGFSESDLGFFLQELKTTEGNDSSGKTLPGTPDERLTASKEYPFSMGISPTMPVLASGVSNPLYFTLTNVSRYKLNLWEVVLESSGAEFPFEVNATRIKGVFSRPYGDDDRKTDVAFYPMRAKSDLKDGAYDLDFTIRYTVLDDPDDPNFNTSDAAKEIYEQKLSYSVNIKEDPANREGQRVMIAAAPIATQMASYGSQINLQLGLINRGFDPVDIISVTPQISGETDSWPFEILQMDYSKAVGQRLRPLAPGASNGSTSDGTLLMVNFGLMTVRNEISSGYKELKFVVKHKNGDLPIEETEISVYIDIAGNPEVDAKNDPDADKEWPQSKPRLMCTEFKTEPAEVKGGDDFKLTLRLKNTSALTGVQNIRIELGSAAVGEAGIAPFLTESGANSFYVPWIGAEEEYELEVLMTASAQVPQKIYPLQIDMDYEDWQASSISAKESISIQLKQEVRMDHGQIEIMPPDLTVGQEANLMFPIYNKGKTTIYNVTVTIPEGQGVSAPEFFVGNIAAGETAQVDMMVLAEGPTDMEAGQKIQLNYEDENGQVDSKEFDFNIMVNEPMPMDDMSGMDPFDDEGMMPPDMDDPAMGEMEGRSKLLQIMPLWAWILLGVAILILVVLLIGRAKKRRRRKRMHMEDEAYFRDLMQ